MTVKGRDVVWGKVVKVCHVHVVDPCTHSMSSLRKQGPISLIAPGGEMGPRVKPEDDD